MPGSLMPAPPDQDLSKRGVQGTEATSCHAFLLGVLAICIRGSPGDPGYLPCLPRLALAATVAPTMNQRPVTQ